MKTKDLRGSIQVLVSKYKYYLTISHKEHKTLTLILFALICNR